MNHKTAYLWGPLSSFTAPLAAWLINKGWHVHIATKSTLNFISLSALDLSSSARAYLEEALGGREAYRTFHDRLKLVEPNEVTRDTKYDCVIFAGLPPNYDDARVPRAPWTADELPRVAKIVKGVPIFLVSSLWGAVQKDSVVPEELEFERRKPLSNWERICQSYEMRLLKGLATIEANWYFVRIPMLSGATVTGEPFGFTGPSNLFRELDPQEQTASESNWSSKQEKTVNLAYNPDSTLWFLPVDVAVSMFWRFLEDENRPRVCNFVSNQATLNREWLHHLGEALGLKEVVQSDRDSLNLPAVMRKLLLENVQVRTRNLFEVAGRYQLAPVKFDKEYFAKVVQAGREKHWGRAKAPSTTAAPFQFSQRLAHYYFEQFIPSQFDEQLLHKATKGGITIGFAIKDSGGLGWVLKSRDGEVIVERIEKGSEKPKICFNFSGQTMTKLIQSKLPLHRALLLREVEVEGPLIDALRVTQVIDKFLREHPIDAHELSLFQEDGITV